MKKLMIMALATLFGCGLLAQDQSVIDRINKNGIEPNRMMYWIGNNDWTNEFLRKAEQLTQSDLEYVSKMAEEEIAELDKVIDTFNKIIGKEKKESKIDKKLKKYFDDPAKAMEAYRKTIEIKARAEATLSAVNANKGRVYGTMPSDKLTKFHYSKSNGYAGWRMNVELDKNENGIGGILTYKNGSIMEYRDENTKPKPTTAEVDDSVFEKVYEMIKEGQLYDEANSYQPFMDVTDGTGWSLWMKFGKSSISTDGYMAGPNHREALDNILKYLIDIFRQVHPEVDARK